MATRALMAGLVAAAGLAAFAAYASQATPPKESTEPIPLSTGKYISPIGEHTPVGSFPCNMALSPDGRYVAVTGAGSREYLTILRTSDGAVTSQAGFNGKVTGKNQNDGLYFGVSFAPGPNRETLLYVSRGCVDRVNVYQLDDQGRLSDALKEIENAPAKGKPALCCAGLGLSSDGGMLFVANNETSMETDLKGSLSVIDAISGVRTAQVELPGFPLGVAALTKGAFADHKVYVSSERDAKVTVVNPTTGKVLSQIPVGSNPTYMLLNKGQTRLYVANSTSDTVSVIGTNDDTVRQTILVRPDAARGLPGATPLGMALSPDEKTLYVALADMNVVAVVNLPSGTLRGYIPTGWYPTSVVARPDGKALLVACAKGIEARKPNKEPNDPARKSTYILNLYEGTVSLVKVPTDKELARMSVTALDNNRFTEINATNSRASSFNPGIKHVIYVVKENRTYDQVLGDMKQGNGDPSICLFGKEITPNQHALAERFALLDNFYVCAEVSADGWSWSTGGIANEYNQRNHTYNYAGRGRDYDFEGQNNGVPPDLLDLADAGRPSGGYLWDLCLAKGVSYRNYGMYIAAGESKDKDGKLLVADNEPTKKALLDRTCIDYRQFDMSFTDSDAWVQYNAPAPKQMKSYGKNPVKSRYEAWKREFDEYLRSGEMPQLMLIRLPFNHTVGTAAGYFTPQAMAADNDYALGRIVEDVSNSPFWKSTAIIVLEDDAQNGTDHVDAHRSPIQVISPFVQKNTHDSRFYNTDSALRTIELLLGLPPMTHMDGTAKPIDVFGKTASNDAPYKAILPPKEIICAVNKSTAYRSADSTRLLNILKEESLPDLELNDILWGAIKGTKTPMPKIKRNVIIREDD